MLTPSERAAAGGDGRPPLNDRVMHAFNATVNKFQKRYAEAGVCKLVMTLSRAGSFMSLPLLAKRTLMPADQVDTALEEAQQGGFITVEVEEHAGRIACLTNDGAIQAALWKSERDASTTEFLSPLSNEEKETLVALMRKLFVDRS